MSRVFTTTMRRVMEAKTRRRDGSKQAIAERAERMAMDVPPLLIRLHQAREVNLNLPVETALSSVMHRIATPVGEWAATADLTLDADDVESSGLNAEIWADPMAAA